MGGLDLVFRCAGALVACVLAVICCTVGVLAEDRVVLGINGPARAEHGGFYQAIADGAYRRYGLDVVLR